METTITDSEQLNTAKTSTARPIFDLAKFILSILVVAIHTLFLPEILYPWLRIGVPLFFMISAYFLFSKINAATEQQKGEAVKKFCVRNLILYLFWFIVLLPKTLSIRGWFTSGFFSGLLQFFKSLLFGSTFVASWFIMASVIATLLIFFASKKIGNIPLLIISGIIYALVCLRSSYFSLFADLSFVQTLMRHYESIFSTPQLSFPVALFWITCGKCFADKTFQIPKKNAWILCIVSALLLYGEWRLVRSLNGSYSNDCYFFLAPLCISIFSLLDSAPDFTLNNSLFLRKSSTILYAVHGTLAIIVNDAIRANLGENWIFLSFFITLAVCLLLSLLIVNLEKVSLFKWLKYSH